MTRYSLVVLKLPLDSSQLSNKLMAGSGAVYARWYRNVKSYWILSQREAMMTVAVTSGTLKRANFQSAHQHSVLYRHDALPVDQPMVSEHRGQFRRHMNHFLFQI